VSDPKVLSLMPVKVRGSVLVADIPSEIEIPDFHGGSEEMYSKRLNFPLWIYQGDRRLDLARFPNRPSNPREYRPGYIFTGDLTQGKQGAEFKLENQQEKLVAWMREPDLWVYGLFLHDYADMKMRVVKIDAEKNTMKLDNRWYPRGFAENRPFHVFNALSEMDVPGEWVIDRSQRKVYLLPSADVVREPLVFGATEYLVKGTNVSDLVFDGLAFRHCRRDALRFDESCNVRVQASKISLTGAWGVTVNGGSDCRVDGCDLVNLGEGGVRLHGGDWTTLTPSRHDADNNHMAH
jgi:hypothetical protein